MVVQGLHRAWASPFFLSAMHRGTLLRPDALATFRTGPPPCAGLHAVDSQLLASLRSLRFQSCTSGQLGEWPRSPSHGAVHAVLGRTPVSAPTGSSAATPRASAAARRHSVDPCDSDAFHVADQLAVASRPSSGSSRSRARRAGVAPPHSPGHDAPASPCASVVASSSPVFVPLTGACQLPSLSALVLSPWAASRSRRPMCNRSAKAHLSRSVAPAPAPSRARHHGQASVCQSAGSCPRDPRGVAGSSSVRSRSMVPDLAPLDSIEPIERLLGLLGSWRISPAPPGWPVSTVATSSGRTLPTLRLASGVQKQLQPVHVGRPRSSMPA